MRSLTFVILYSGVRLSATSSLIRRVRSFLNWDSKVYPHVEVYAECADVWCEHSRIGELKQPSEIETALQVHQQKLQLYSTTRQYEYPKSLCSPQGCTAGGNSTELTLVMVKNVDMGTEATLHIDGMKDDVIQVPEWERSIHHFMELINDQNAIDDNDTTGWVPSIFGTNAYDSEYSMEVINPGVIFLIPTGSGRFPFSVTSHRVVVLAWRHVSSDLMPQEWALPTPERLRATCFHVPPPETAVGTRRPVVVLSPRLP